MPVVRCGACGAVFAYGAVCPWDGQPLQPLANSDPLAVAFHERTLTGWSFEAEGEFNTSPFLDGSGGVGHGPGDEGAPGARHHTRE